MHQSKLQGWINQQGIEKEVLEQAPYLLDLLFPCLYMMSDSDECDDLVNTVYQRQYRRPFGSYQGLMSLKVMDLSSTYPSLVLSMYTLRWEKGGKHKWVYCEQWKLIQESLLKKENKLFTERVIKR